MAKKAFCWIVSFSFSCRVDSGRRRRLPDPYRHHPPLPPRPHRCLRRRLQTQRILLRAVHLQRGPVSGRGL